MPTLEINDSEEVQYFVSSTYGVHIQTMPKWATPEMRLKSIYGASLVGYRLATPADVDWVKATGGFVPK